MTHTCHCCGVAFVSEQPKARFCSTSCATRSRIQRLGTGLRLRRLPQAEDYEFNSWPETQP